MATEPKTGGTTPAAPTVAAAPTQKDGTLHVRDSRTALEYSIPITDNTVAAAEFTKIKPFTNSVARTKASGGIQLFDPGLQNTAVKKTYITGRDPETGLPMFRGYSSKQLWEWECEFEELFHLMVFGKYPSAAEKDALQRALAEEMTKVPEIVVKVIQSFDPSTHPLPMLLSGLSAYLAAYPDLVPVFKGRNIYHGNRLMADTAVIRTTAAYAVVVGLTSSHRKRIPFTPADPKKTYLENVFTMMGQVDPQTNAPDPKILSCFRRGMPFNSDNGMTQSNLVLLATASSLPDPISCLISAVAAAYGPLHYGAQESAYRTLAEIGGPANVPRFLDQVKRRERRLFGYGHRTFAVEDPRLQPVKTLLSELGASPETEPLLATAYEIDRVAAQDEYFKSRHLSANADFYTVFLFRAFGFEPDMIGAANLCMRIIGLMAQWRESMDQEIKLFRPRDWYVGQKKAKVAPVHNSRL